jgi:hypothetical protein
MTRRRTMTKEMLRRYRASAIRSYKLGLKRAASSMPLPDFVAFVKAAAKSARGFSRKSGWTKIAKFSADLPIAQRDLMITSLRKLISDAERTITRLQAAPAKSVKPELKAIELHRDAE